MVGLVSRVGLVAATQDVIELSNEHLASFLPQLFFAFCENTYFSEDWWEALSTSRKDRLRTLMEISNPYYYPPEYNYSESFTSWNVIDRIKQ